VTKATITQHKGGGTSFTGRAAVNLYAAVVLLSGIRFYLKTGMKVSSGYTPTNMLAAATGHTGKTYKRGQLAQAALDLDAFIQEQKTNGSVSFEGDET